MTANAFKGTRSRDENLRKLYRIAGRLGVQPGAIRVRAVGRTEMRLWVRWRGIDVTRSCDSQGDKDRNFACLVQWLEDLVRNVERRIETVGEAFGEREMVVRRHAYGATRENLYQGDMGVGEARRSIARSLERMGLDGRYELDWGEDGARIRFGLPGGGVVEKTSVRQMDGRRNVAALALWLRCRAKNRERGIERDLVGAFRANLLTGG